MDTDVGPIITGIARASIQNHIDIAEQDGRLLKQMATPEDGTFVGPAVIQVAGIKELAEEVFGPVLHVATFKASELDTVLDDINASGYGLTFGLHTRIDDRVEYITKRLAVGNIYVNRNQIGAAVESQPFGGEGLSGTGPKAGGPNYVARFKRQISPAHDALFGPPVDARKLQAALDAAARNRNTQVTTRLMRGPTGELNRWSTHPRGTVLCLGPTIQDAEDQMRIARDMGCPSVGVAPGLSGSLCCSGVLAPATFSKLKGIGLVVFWGAPDQATKYRQSLAARNGPIIPFTNAADFETACVVERHLCVDTTAVGGNTDLMA